MNPKLKARRANYRNLRFQGFTVEQARRMRDKFQHSSALCNLSACACQCEECKEMNKGLK